MGIHVKEDDPELGVPCGNFDPTDETPLKIYAIFKGIIKCPVSFIEPPNDIVVTLTQTDGNSCIWTGTFPSFGVSVELDISVLNPGHLRIDDFLGRTFFDSRIWASPTEHMLISGIELACKPATVGIRGFGTIIWKKKAVELIEELGLWRSSKILMEFFFCDNYDVIYKFCNSGRNYNVMIRLTP